jgi:hypothetical protein
MAGVVNESQRRSTDFVAQDHQSCSLLLLIFKTERSVPE